VLAFLLPSSQVGKEFDALLIDTRAPGPPSDPVFDIFEENTFDVRP
jgi:hypothetical protein